LALTHFSLFSGIGGIDLAAEWAGFTTIGQCEYADYPTKVLEKHWPDVPRWKDVRDVTRFSIRERGIDPDRITLLSGGFPCQPHSLAGKRLASADERDLWGEFARVICETNPRWVLGENVAGLLSSENGRFFGRVLRDLAEMGYRVGWACYGAADVGANHRRNRTFIVANAVSGGRGENGQRRGMDGISGRRANDLLPAAQSSADVAHPNVQRFLSQSESPRQCRQASVGSGGQDVADTDGQPGLQAGSTTCAVRSGWFSWDDADSGGRDGHPGPDWWSVEPDVGRVAHGVPHRVDRLKCLGNAVVPQQVYPILKAIAEIEGQIGFL
jgi:DNA (cytosine-5)-methyltransferase 1